MAGRRRTPILFGTALLGLAITIAAIVGRTRSDGTDPGRRFVAVVVSKQGTPTIGEENPSVGAEIEQGRTISTPSRSAIHIRIGERIEVAIDHAARVELRSLRAGGVRLVVSRGGVRVHVRDLPAAEHFAVEVGGRSLESDGGVFLGADGRVSVLDGKVSVNPGEPDAPTPVAGETWRELGGAGPIDELDARRLAALVAGRPWVAALPPP